MEASRGLGVRGELSFSVTLSSEVKVTTNGIGVVIRIHEVTPRVVGRVDVDHLDLAVVVLLQDLEYFKVIAFNHHVLSVVPVN